MLADLRQEQSVVERGTASALESLTGFHGRNTTRARREDWHFQSSAHGKYSGALSVCVPQPTCCFP